MVSLKLTFALHSIYYVVGDGSALHYNICPSPHTNSHIHIGTLLVTLCIVLLPNLGREGLGDENLDDGEETKSVAGVDGYDTEDGDPAVLLAARVQLGLRPQPRLCGSDPHPAHHEQRLGGPG